LELHVVGVDWRGQGFKKRTIDYFLESAPGDEVDSDAELEEELSSPYIFPSLSAGAISSLMTSRLLCLEQKMNRISKIA
jgi:hypothetical protein